MSSGVDKVLEADSATIEQRNTTQARLSMIDGAGRKIGHADPRNQTSNS